MTPEQVLYMVMLCCGEISRKQYLDIYDYPPTLQAVFFDECGLYKNYKYEVWFYDKYEPIYFNVKDE